MTNHSVQFEATDAGLVLTNAILLYGADGATAAPHRAVPAFASIHPVVHEAGQPTIGTGAPLSHANLRQWSEALGRNLVPEIIPANVLVSHPDLLVWWVPEQVRTAYFALTTPQAGLKALAQRTSVQVPYPAHLFVATRGGLGVYALPANSRPAADTPVLCSPVLNVFANGQLCWGNVRKPKTLAPAAMGEYERAVFDSWSTHPNPGQEASVSGKGGLVKLWDDLAARRAIRFPVKRLRPFTSADRRYTARGEPMTLGQLIAGRAR
jgi:PRTRC genetic system protein B